MIENLIMAAVISMAVLGGWLIGAAILAGIWGLIKYRMERR